jgi:hypothetical protein
MQHLTYAFATFTSVLAQPITHAIDIHKSGTSFTGSQLFYYCTDPASSPDPGTLHFRFASDHRRGVLSPNDADEAYANPDIDQPDYNIDSDIEIDQDLPMFSPRGIHTISWRSSLVEAVLSRLWSPGQRPRTAFQGPSHRIDGLESRAGADCFTKIEKHFPTSTSKCFQVPKLQGYVQDTDSECVLGLLREDPPSSQEDGRLSRINTATISSGRRHKWTTEDLETADQLHKTGLVWGGATADNIIVDDKENAWLLDFGSGWTEGWVHEELTDTTEGDRQAVSHLMHLLGVER